MIQKTYATRSGRFQALADKLTHLPISKRSTAHTRWQLATDLYVQLHTAGHVSDAKVFYTLFSVLPGVPINVGALQRGRPKAQQTKDRMTRIEQRMDELTLKTALFYGLITNAS